MFLFAGGVSVAVFLTFFFSRNILDSDNYSPIPVTNEEIYKKIVGQFPFQDAELEKVNLKEETSTACLLMH